MCVNISFLHEILTCQDRYPEAQSRARSPKGELSGTFLPFHPGLLRLELNSSAAEKRKILGPVFFEMKDLVCFLLISRMISTSLVPLL